MSENLCPKMESTLNLLGKKWIGLILFKLLDGPTKFSDIERFIPGISARMLTERLKELETLGIVSKNVETGPHIKITYELTRKGIDLSDTFATIGNWAEKWH